MKVLPSRILRGYMRSRGRKYLEVLNLSRYVHNAVIDATLDVLVSVVLVVAESRIRVSRLLIHVIVDYLRVLIFFGGFPFNGRVLLI